MRSLPRKALAVAALATGVALGVDAPPARAAAMASPDELTGVYRVVDLASTKAEIRRRIDAATEDMSLLQGIARDRLYETTEPMAVLVIGFPPDRISVGYLGERAVVTDQEGTSVTWKNRLGDRVTVTQTFEAGQIVQRYKGAMGGRRKSVYSLAPAGDRITVHTVVTADIVPEPVEFRVTYLRK